VSPSACALRQPGPEGHLPPALRERGHRRLGTANSSGQCPARNVSLRDALGSLACDRRVGAVSKPRGAGRLRNGEVFSRGRQCVRQPLFLIVVHMKDHVGAVHQLFCGIERRADYAR
jgi:hypothetical protein